MIRRESERLLEEIGRWIKRTKEIIWLSRFCRACEYYKEEGRRMNCNRWKVRIVKPFHGRQSYLGQRPVRRGTGEKELVVENIDWDAKWKEISERVIEMSVDMVNGGFPYFCFRAGDHEASVLRGALSRPRSELGCWSGPTVVSEVRDSVRMEDVSSVTFLA